jgi:diguanylate cyclase (GGDEF)-like protein
MMTVGQLAAVTHGASQLALAAFAAVAARQAGRTCSKLWVGAWLAGAGFVLAPSVLPASAPGRLLVGCAAAAHAALLVGATRTLRERPAPFPWAAAAAAASLWGLILAPLSLESGGVLNGLLVGAASGLAAFGPRRPAGPMRAPYRFVQVALVVRAGCLAAAAMAGAPEGLIALLTLVAGASELLVAGGVLLSALQWERRAQHATQAQLEWAQQLLRDNVAVDSLTSFCDRRLFRRLVDDVRRGRFPGCGVLMVLDMDGLKHINDTRGHSAGDAAIRRLALTIRGRLEPTDMPIRWGGDEFVVVLPGRTLGEGRRIRSGIVAATRRQQIAASVGLAVYDDRLDIVQALRVADGRMYAAKRRRREAGRRRAQQLDLPLETAVSAR